MSTMLPIALKYAAHGWPVLPLISGKKEPATLHGYYDAVTDETQVNELFNKPSNIAIRVGHKANLIVIDPDDKKGKKGTARLVELEERLGPLPVTRTIKTKHGKHFYFRYPEAWLDASLKNEYAPGLDIKFKGYVVAPPSIIGNGEGAFQYEVINEAEPAELPDAWVKEAIKEAPDVSDWERVRGSGPSLTNEHSIRMSDVIEIPKGSRQLTDGFLIKHSIHGATGKGNLFVNLARDLWCCYRHNTGGDPVKWVAVREGFIDCADADQRLDRDTFLRVKDVLRRDGLLNNDTPVSSSNGKNGEQSDVTSEDDAGDELEDENPFAYFDDKRFISKWLAEAIMEKDRFLTFADTNEIYKYNKSSGIYESGAEVYIRKEAQRRLQNEYNTHRVKEVVTFIRDFTSRDRFELIPPLNLIPLANGMYDLTTGERTPYSPDIPLFFKHDGGYHPTLLHPNAPGLRFIENVFSPEDVDTIQEMVGACLYRAPVFKKAFMLLGDGDNGKSVFLTMLRKALGDKTVSKQSIWQITMNRFAPAELYNKCANIHADLGGGDLSYVGTFMILTGGDSLTVEHKHQHPFSYVCYAVLIFSTNALPDVKNPPDQFYKRWILVEMPYKFVDEPKEDFEKARDSNIEATITTDECLSWLITWGLEGLKRLLNNGNFTESECTQEIKERWISKTDSLQAFVSSNVAQSPLCKIPKTEFKAAYEAWCGANGMVPKSDSYIGRHLPRFIPTRQITTTPKCWADIVVEGVAPQIMGERENKGYFRP